MMVKSSLFISLFFVAIAASAVAQDRGSVQTFRFRGTELGTALDSLLRWYAVPLIYLDRDVAGKSVTADCEKCDFEEALTKVIEGQGLQWRVSGDQVMLQKQKTEAKIFATLAGTVTDSLTGEWIVDATVLLRTDDDSTKTYRWCSTNEFGFFSLRNIQPGSYTLVVRSVGHRRVSKAVTVPAGNATLQNLALIPQDVTLQEITVEGERSALTASEGISRGIYIRATPTDQNQYLLEGARIYNPTHFGGVISTFNADALRDVQVLAGGVPPYYGGRIGGVLDVTLRNGMSEGLSGLAGVGSFGSNLVLEGPVAERTTFLLSGRRSYPDVFFHRYQKKGKPSDLRSSEILAKVSHRLQGNGLLTLNGYFGRDTYDNVVADPAGGRLSNKLRWGNAAVNLRWIDVVSPSLFVHASAVYTGYDFDVQQRLTNGLTDEYFPSTYRIEDAVVRGHAEYFYDEHHTVRGGVELVRHSMGGIVSDFSTQIAPVSMDGTSSWELSVYFQDQWRLVPSVFAELGARATSFVAEQGSFSAVDPRFSLLVSLDDNLRLYSSLTSVTQFVHPYRNSGIFLFYPTIFFYPSTETIRPSTSLQVSLGMEKNFDENQFSLALEAYYRMTQNLHEFILDTTRNPTLSDALLLGEGSVQGAELTVTKRTGDLVGSIRYSLSWSSNRFSELNNGNPFTPRFDRRHELYGSLSYSPIPRWTIGALCLLSSDQSPSFRPLDTKTIGLHEPESVDLNGGRLPGFQRLELRLAHTFRLWDLPCQATLRFINGYGLLDPFAWALSDTTDRLSTWKVTFNGPGLFPLYPVVHMSVKF